MAINYPFPIWINIVKANISHSLHWNIVKGFLHKHKFISTAIVT